MRKKGIQLFRFPLFFSRKCRFSENLDKTDKQEAPFDKEFKPGESVYDLSVAEKYVQSNIR